MKVKIVKTHPDAVIPFKTYDRDFCYDLVAVTEEEIAPCVWKYGFGLAMQIEDKSQAEVINSIDIRPRSSVWKHGMILSNCCGTVDEEYTGEISAVFYHVMSLMPRYKVGDVVAQMKLGSTSEIEFMEVEKLDSTKRGEGGYGSTDARRNTLLR